MQKERKLFTYKPSTHFVFLIDTLETQTGYRAM